jgi:hypothetical protein
VVPVAVLEVVLVVVLEVVPVVVLEVVLEVVPVEVEVEDLAMFHSWKNAFPGISS